MSDLKKRTTFTRTIEMPIHGNLEEELSYILECLATDIGRTARSMGVDHCWAELTGPETWVESPLPLQVLRLMQRAINRAVPEAEETRDRVNAAEAKRNRKSQAAAQRGESVNV